MDIDMDRWRYIERDMYIGFDCGSLLPGTVYIGGDFTSSGDGEASNILAWDGAVTLIPEGYMITYSLRVHDHAFVEGI